MFKMCRALGKEQKIAAAALVEWYQNGGRTR